MPSDLALTSLLCLAFNLYFPIVYSRIKSHLIFTVLVGSINIIFMTVSSIGLTCKKGGS
jgi:hypothetical protein